MTAAGRSVGVDPVLKQLLDRPIAYHRAFVRLGGGVSAAVFLSQAFYWHHRSMSGDGWFYKSADEWREETGLTRYEIKEARRHWCTLGVLEQKLQGMPATLHFRVNLEGLAQRLASLTNVVKQDCRTSSNLIDEGRQASLQDVGQTSLPNVVNSDCRTSQNLLIEQRLPKTTADTASSDAEDFIICGRGKDRKKLTGWKLIAFRRFWEAFNYKHGRADAAAAWLNLPDLTPDFVEHIVAAATAEAKRRSAIEQRGGTPIWAQGWLNANRFDDEALRPPAPRRGAATPVIDEAAEKHRQAEKFNEQMRRLGRPELQVSE